MSAPGSCSNRWPVAAWSAWAMGATLGQTGSAVGRFGRWALLRQRQTPDPVLIHQLFRPAGVQYASARFIGFRAPAGPRPPSALDEPPGQTATITPAMEAFPGAGLKNERLVQSSGASATRADALTGLTTLGPTYDKRPGGFL